MPDEQPSGVVVHPGPLPPLAPGPIASSIKKATFEALGALPPGASGAMVRLTHDKGAELAFAHRSADGRWIVDAYVGKAWDKSKSIEWGAEVKILW